MKNYLPSLDQVRSILKEMAEDPDQLPDYCYINRYHVIAVMDAYDKLLEKNNILGEALANSMNVNTQLTRSLSLAENMIESWTISLPKHISFTLNHNPNASFYDSVEEYVTRNEDRLGMDWPSEEAKKRSIETNELWEAHWYPHTPIGFYIAYAPTLEELLAFINNEEKWK